MSLEVAVFSLLALVSVLGALGVVLARNPVHSAIGLVLSFLNVAAIYLVARAEFLAVVQVIVYAGRSSCSSSSSPCSCIRTICRSFTGAVRCAW
jgi:energy-converting hydrogenase Eha subunit C